MKHILFFLLLFSALFSHAQFDTTGLAKGDVLRFDGTSFIDRLPIKLRKAHVETIVMGTRMVYLPETDLQGGNVYNSLAKIITYQLPLSINPTTAQLQLITNLITDVLEPTTPPPVFITEKVDGERATFEGSWVRANTPGWYGVPTPTIAYSNVPGSFVSYTFTGTKVEIFAERKTSHGTGNISIDNGPVQPVSFIGPSALPVLIYSSPDLPNGVHTIRLTVVSGYSLLDFLIIQKPE